MRYKFNYLHIPLAIIISLFIVMSGCSQKQNQNPTTSAFTEPTIPAHYTTYTDELQLFSISYPPEWEVNPQIKELEGPIKEEMKNIAANLPIDEVCLLFMAGLVVEQGYLPSVNIVIEPIPQGVSTHEQMVDAEIRGLKQIVEDYVQVSRIKTTIGGREATIMNVEYTLPSMGRFHYLVAFILTNTAAWAITCGSYPENFSRWEGDFQSVLRSVRILQ